MLHSISKLIDRGVLSHYDDLQRLRIRLLNFDLLFGIGLPVIALLISILLGVYDIYSIIAILFFIALSSTSFYLNSRQYHDIASLLFLSCCLVGVFTVCLLFGKETEAHIYFLSISVSSFVYHLRSKVMAWIFFGLQLLAYLTIYYLPYVPFFQWGESDLKVIGNSNIALAVAFFGSKLILFAQMFLTLLRQLQDSNALLSTTLESTADGILAFDLNEKITRYNQKFVDLWNIPTSLLENKNRIPVALYAMKSVKDPDRFLSSVKSFSTDPEIIKFDTLYFKDGRIIERYTQPQWIDDEIVGRVISFRDVTAKVQQALIIQENVSLLNEKNKELEKYIESNLQLENFAYIASHDLKAPVRTIVSFSQLLQKSAGEKLNKDEKDFLNFIIGATHNMQHLIEALLTYARVNTQEHQTKTVDIAHLLSNIEGDLYAMIEETEAKIVFEVYPPMIEGDPTKLRRLFQNLIQNAIKFRRPGITPVVEIAGVEQEKHWLFSVKDNGIGIEQAFFDKIFLLFRKLHNIGAYKGTGIGLALCKKIVEHHDGKIWLESTLGEGTTFYFTIKKAEPNKFDSAPKNPS